VAEAGEFRYVGFWARAWASLVDSVLLAMVIAPVLWVAYGWGYFDAYIGHYRQVLGGDLLAAAPAGRGPLDPLMTYGFPAIAILAFWICRAATPGKMLIGARIVDAVTGAPPTTTQLVGRYLGYFVSTIPLGLGLLWVAFDARKQGWHDKLAGTVVVRARRGGGAAG